MAETTTYRLPEAVPFDNHGKTLAGWVLFWGVTVGLIVATIGIFTTPAIMWAGIVITIAAIIGSIVLRGMGKGQRITKRESADWYA